MGASSSSSTTSDRQLSQNSCTYVILCFILIFVMQNFHFNRTMITGALVKPEAATFWRSNMVVGSLSQIAKFSDFDIVCDTFHIFHIAVKYSSLVRVHYIINVLQNRISILVVLQITAECLLLFPSTSDSFRDK